MSDAPTDLIARSDEIDHVNFILALTFVSDYNIRKESTLQLACKSGLDQVTALRKGN